MAALENKMAGLSTHPPKFAVRGRFVHANARRAGLIEFVDDGLIVVEDGAIVAVAKDADQIKAVLAAHRPQDVVELAETEFLACLLYTSPSPRDRTRSRMPSSA